MNVCVDHPVVGGRCLVCDGPRDGHFHIDPKTGTITEDTRFPIENGLGKAANKASR